MASVSGIPNHYLRGRIFAAYVDQVHPQIEPRTELDSHANMVVVVGSNCFGFDSVQDKTCEVEPFDPAIGTAKHVPIVDAALSYDCIPIHIGLSSLL